MTLPVWFPMANILLFGENAILVTLPKGVPLVGQLLYTEPLGKCTNLKASRLALDAIHNNCPSGLKTNEDIDVIKFSTVLIGFGCVVSGANTDRS